MLSVVLALGLFGGIAIALNFTVPASRDNSERYASELERLTKHTDEVLSKNMRTFLRLQQALEAVEKIEIGGTVTMDDLPTFENKKIDSEATRIETLKVLRLVSDAIVENISRIGEQKLVAPEVGDIDKADGIFSPAQKLMLTEVGPDKKMAAGILSGWDDTSEAKPKVVALILNSPEDSKSKDLPSHWMYEVAGDTVHRGQKVLVLRRVTKEFLLQQSGPDK